MIATVLQFVVPALCVLGGVLYTNRQSAKAADATAATAKAAADKAASLESKKVDAEAYERARTFDQQVVDGIRLELDRARSEISEVRAELVRERNENRELRRHVDALERTVERLRARLSAAGLDINGTA